MSEEGSGKFLVVSGVAIVTLAVIVLMGIAITAGYSKVLRDETTVVSEGVTLPASGASARYGTAGQFPFLKTLSGCVNATTGDVLNAANFSITEGTTDGGIITLALATSEFNGSTVNCTTTTYLAATLESRNADTFATGLAVFGSFAGVIVLALVGMVIIRLFRKKS